MKLKKIKVAVIENDEKFRSAFCNELLTHSSILLVNEYISSEDFLESGRMDQYELLFLDVMLPGMSGLDLLYRLYGEKTTLKTIIMTGLSTEDTIIKAIQSGAIGYLWKSEIRNVKDTIDIFLEGGANISPTIALKMMKLFKNSVPNEPPLTPREKQILEILVSGANCQRGAELLNISVNTMRKHVRNIYEKLHVRNRMELAKRAREFGIM